MKTIWIVLIAIGVCLFALLFSPVRLAVFYDSEIRVRLRIAFVRLNLYPKKEKAVSFRAFSYRKTHKKRKEKTAARATPSKPKKKTDVLSTVKILLAVLKKIVEPLTRSFRIRLARVHITVASDDAAKTALLYGGVSQSVAYVAELLDRFTRLDPAKNNDIQVRADFLRTSFSCDIMIVLSSTVIRSLDILVKLFYNYLKEKAKFNHTHQTNTEVQKNHG